jgi:predicted phosphodiesterase
MRNVERIAILADIHGNSAALEAVLGDIDKADLEHIVFAGDLVMNGPHPVQVLERVIGLNQPAVIGNTDEEVLNQIDNVALWTARQLRSPHIQFLRSLPISYRVTPPYGKSPADDLLIVHSTPRSCFDLLILNPHPLGTTFNEVTAVNDAMAMLNSAEANLIVYGHIHYFSEGLIGNQRVVSIGAVGFPFDGNANAAYAIAGWDGKAWSLTQKRIAYNYEDVALSIEQSTMPYAARYAKMLRASNWFPRPTNET